MVKQTDDYIHVGMRPYLKFKLQVPAHIICKLNFHQLSYAYWLDLVACVTCKAVHNHVCLDCDMHASAEYESPFWGFKDDAEFWFPDGKNSIVEYRR